jgi:CheY-like chemotaxis protein
MRVLLADDDLDTRQLMGVLLQRAGYQVRLVRSGAEALRAQQAEPADVLITDIFMADVDGLEAITMFRREHPAVRIIAMSGGGAHFQNESYLETARVAGADAAFRKPFEMAALLETLRGLAVIPRLDAGRAGGLAP